MLYVAKRRDRSPDGKKLPLPIDIRNTRVVANALPAFKEKGKIGRKKKDWFGMVIGPPGF